MTQLLWICLGGALGTGARHLLSNWTSARLGAAFPFGTLTVNLIGSFLVAAIAHASSQELLPPALRVVLVTGVLGGFTTYSAFSLQTYVFMRAGAWNLAGLYTLATVVGCLLACQLGWACARAAFD